MEKIYETHINGCLQLLYERSYYDFETRDNFINILFAMFLYAASMFHISTALLPFINTQFPPEKFLKGGIVMSQNKKVPLII